MKMLRAAALAVCLSICALAQTTVTDIVRMQPGSVWSGEITITWPGFTTVDGNVVTPDSMTVIVNSGRLSVSLWPTVGATPTVAYFAHYLTTAGPNRGKEWDDPPWNVPASPSVVGLGDIRPRSGAANTLLNGTGAPSDLIGANGDYYLHTSNMCLYGAKAANAWPGTCTTLIGATGSPGIMQSGAGAPDNGVGADGQFYINLTTSCMYGPKASGTWPGGCTSLIGPPGSGVLDPGANGVMVRTALNTSATVSGSATDCVKVNGTSGACGAGVADPGSSGVMVRTALDTSIVVAGNSTDCVKVNGTSGACGTGSNTFAALIDLPSNNAALAAELNGKAGLNSPTFTGTVNGITKGMVGLGNADNTADVNKPISGPTQTALNGKMPSLSGNGAVKMVGGSPALVAGSATDCVLVNGSSATCGTGGASGSANPTCSVSPGATSCVITYPVTLANAAVATDPSCVNTDVVPYPKFPATTWTKSATGMSITFSAAPTNVTCTVNISGGQGATGASVVETAQMFTGDGATAVFTITQDPVAGTAITVWRNGLLQASTADYSFSGRDATFVTAPSAGDAIQILYYVSALIATTAGISDGYYCSHIVSGTPTYVSVATGLCGTGGVVGGLLSWASLTSSQWAALNSSQWAALTN